MAASTSRYAQAPATRCEATLSGADACAGRVALNASGSAWISLHALPPALAESTAGAEAFEALFDLRPRARGSVRSWCKSVAAHRFYASFLATPPPDASKIKVRSYMFSDGADVAGRDLPRPFLPFLDHLNEGRGGDGQPPAYNQVVVNWYETGDDHTPLHTDCEDGFVEGSDVAVVSLVEPAAPAPAAECAQEVSGRPVRVQGASGNGLRLFRVRPHRRATGDDYAFDRLDIETSHGSVIVMGGDCQTKFRHGVPKAQLLVPKSTPALQVPAIRRRISLSFRSFGGEGTRSCSTAETSCTVTLPDSIAMKRKDLGDLPPAKCGRVAGGAGSLTASDSKRIFVSETIGILGGPDA